ncbi:protoporphyrinogen oxidase HemJ [Oryzibacter oryziterrae]|uniref:protoporphyrinogen oxidase HemJ n=1 Tax=Oryzibacter oryziterrae TaxID=2766474 RepID=UPI001F463A78|nr:protoporphyrinogen oxidase HemJ [Oryzibacter oryziterrae]
MITDLYSWLKVLHVVSMVAWMAGIFYLPRLFVYHVDAEIGSRQSDTFKVMERRLYRGIMMPAMISTWVFGLWIGVLGGWFQGVYWLHAKLMFVVGLTLFHFLCDVWRKAFAADANTHTSRFFRIINEVPTLLLLVIVILVIIKPF